MISIGISSERSSSSSSMEDSFLETGLAGLTGALLPSAGLAMASTGFLISFSTAFGFGASFFTALTAAFLTGFALAATFFFATAFFLAAGFLAFAFFTTFLATGFLLAIFLGL